jgi:hypothetical protein
VREPAESALLLAPVEVAGPVRKQRMQILRVDSGFPAGGVHAVRPARPLDPIAQVGEHRLVHGDGERLDCDCICSGSHADRLHH